MANTVQFKKLRIHMAVVEPIRIGGPEDPISERHNPVAVVGGKVTVPGASLKGALRNALERYLIAKFWQGGAWSSGALAAQPCVPGSSLSEDEQSLVKNGRYRGPNCHYPCKHGDRGEKEPKIHSICPACYLFGAQGLVGFVRVPFLFTDASYNELYAARLDRMTSTVTERTNRPYEVVPQGAAFEGDMLILMEDTAKDWKLGQPRPLKALTQGDAWLKPGVWDDRPDLVELVKELLTSIDTIGGYKSRGCGRVKIEVTGNK